MSVQLKSNNTDISPNIENTIIFSIIPNEDSLWDFTPLVDYYTELVNTPEEEQIHKNVIVFINSIVFYVDDYDWDYADDEENSKILLYLNIVPLLNATLRHSNSTGVYNISQRKDIVIDPNNPIIDIWSSDYGEIISTDIDTNINISLFSKSGYPESLDKVYINNDDFKKLKAKFNRNCAFETGITEDNYHININYYIYLNNSSTSKYIVDIIECKLVKVVNSTSYIQVVVEAVRNYGNTQYTFKIPKTFSNYKDIIIDNVNGTVINEKKTIDLREVGLPSINNEIEIDFTDDIKSTDILEIMLTSSASTYITCNIISSQNNDKNFFSMFTCNGIIYSCCIKPTNINNVVQNKCIIKAIL